MSAATIPVNTSVQGVLTDKLIAFVNIRLMNKSKSVQGLELFENADFYDQLQIISSEASWRPVNLIVFGISVIREAITVISMVFLLSKYNPLIGLLVLLAIIPQSLVSYKIQQDSFETMVTRSPDARKAQYYSEVLLTSRDAKEVRLFNMFDYFINLYHSTYLSMHRKVTDTRVKQMWVSLILLLVSTLISFGSLVWVVVSIRDGKLSAGIFLVFVSTITATANSVYSLIESSSLLLDTLLYMKKYFTFISIEEDSDFTGKMTFPDSIQTIAFKDINFSYPNSKELALKNVDFVVRGGEKIAIVGENGSGKSTLVKLLMRFYDPNNGSISVNNQNIKEYDIHNFRSNLGTVFQDYSKFFLTIRDSISLGDIKKSGDTERIELAMQNGGFYDDFKSKGLTLKTQLGKQFTNGIDLSGGQWQKLAISRAFFADSKILILDEPTASLDPKSEADIYKRFISMAQDKTTFFITHRMAAVKLADRVLVLDHGKIVGFDTHENLMKSNEYYRDYYNIQADEYK
ncbi:ABC transporter ATP-binding protein [Lentilactobacillus sp. Marseille-Q4993]|uniref:ABC transporter ATP-binding protein n=1 Tax=Lentilactobacillus sp. Marseille-Q4993 TaxID=3039492 RepID=UPI0024BD1CAE|nr:ABC transporter ATP-binding protein [Lentilactobacillus sp. Marseille-Q4993]